MDAKKKSTPPVDEGFLSPKQKYNVYFKRHGEEDKPLQKTVMSGSSMLDVTKRAVSSLGNAAVYKVEMISEAVKEVPLQKGKVVKVEGVPVKLKQAATVEANVADCPVKEESDEPTKQQIDPKLAKRIGDKIGVEWNKIPFKEFVNGINTETEHKNSLDPTPEKTDIKDWIRYAMIAHDHLKERPDYYAKLEKMEQEPITKEQLTKVVEGILREAHYPPKALDYNALPESDGFWGLGMKQAQNMAGMRGIENARSIGDAILWLNMVAMEWKKGHR